MPKRSSPVESATSAAGQAAAPECSAASYPFLNGFRALATLPSALFHFLGLIANPDSDGQQVAEFIWKDPGLLARAISILNTGSCEQSLAANQLQPAIASLPRNRVRYLSYTTPLLCPWEPWQPPDYSLLFWERSLLCAHACEALARQLNLPMPEQYYVAGLLHDIGYLLFLHKRPENLAAVLERWAAQPTDLLEIERQVMGIDHCQLGLEAARKLDLSPWIQSAIAHHHAPSADSDCFTRITAIGSAFCNFKGADFFPARVLARDNWKREMHAILGGLLPAAAQRNSAELLAAMENCVPPVRRWIAELIRAPLENVSSPAHPSDPPLARVVAAAASSRTWQVGTKTLAGQTPSANFRDNP
ncbi:MAG: HDOD domain-containing protein [Acidobacteria bacterium]|nr:HDOD domain-containing protein [Acidobacteriota bacterium]